MPPSAMKMLRPWRKSSGSTETLGKTAGSAAPARGIAEQASTIAALTKAASGPNQTSSRPVTSGAAIAATVRKASLALICAPR